MISDTLSPKKVSDSALETTYMVLPEHTNPVGNIFGGTIMAWIDILAACVAYRHCRCQVVTASMDDLHFISPVKLGDLVTLKGAINFTGTTSMEIGVKVISENPFTGEPAHTASAYLTFVALDEAGKPKTISQIQPLTDDEKRRYVQGQARRKLRLERKQMVVKKG